jgi:hypothetical protein
MKLNLIDWLIIAAYFALSLVMGLYYAKRAGRSTEAQRQLSSRFLPFLDLRFAISRRRVLKLFLL